MIVQVLPHLVPYRRWKHEHRSLKVNDIVLVLYDRKLGKGVYKLGRVMSVHPDDLGVVRTLTVGMQGKDKGVGALTYVPKALDEHRLGVQRVAVICPVEEQDLGAEERIVSTEDLGAEDLELLSQDLDAEDRDGREQDLNAGCLDAEDLDAAERT